jgi:hypothetical protein
LRVIAPSFSYTLLDISDTLRGIGGVLHARIRTGGAFRSATRDLG